MFSAFVFACFIIFIDIRCFTICVNGMTDLLNQLVAVQYFAQLLDRDQLYAEDSQKNICQYAFFHRVLK